MSVFELNPVCTSQYSTLRETEMVGEFCKQGYVISIQTVKFMKIAQYLSIIASTVGCNGRENASKYPGALYLMRCGTWCYPIP